MGKIEDLIKNKKIDAKGLEKILNDDDLDQKKVSGIFGVKTAMEGIATELQSLNAKNLNSPAAKPAQVVVKTPTRWKHTVKRDPSGKILEVSSIAQ